MTTSLNAVDLIIFQKLSCNRTSAVNEACFQEGGLPRSDIRISW